MTYWTESQVSEELQIALPTLRRWRVLGKGPKYVKIGKLVRYPIKQFTSD